jgi:hypothetical protein
VDRAGLGTGAAVLATITGFVIAVGVVGALVWDCYRHPIGKSARDQARHREAERAASPQSAPRATPAPAAQASAAPAPAAPASGGTPADRAGAADEATVDVFKTALAARRARHRRSRRPVVPVVRRGAGRSFFARLPD